MIVVTLLGSVQRGEATGEAAGEAAGEEEIVKTLVWSAMVMIRATDFGKEMTRTLP